MQRDPLTEKIIGLAIDVHRELGPGLLEAAYEECLCHELSIGNIPYQRQVPIPISYKDIELDCGFRVDVMIENTLIIELKAVEKILPIHEAQLLTYLKLTGIGTGC